MSILGTSIATKIPLMTSGGLDSLGISEFANMLSQASGREFRAADLFDHPTIESVYNFFVDEAGLLAFPED